MNAPRHTPRTFFSCVSVASLSLLTGFAFAATGTLEEIVVTAQKRTQSVQDVPISITVLGEDQVERMGFQDLTDLARASASLEFSTDNSPGGGAVVRGIGTVTVSGQSAQSSVSVVLDGVVLSNLPVSDIFDIERVEVLKGPQGTLFGSSVSSGVISITTKAPDPTAASFRLNTEYASDSLGSEYDRLTVRGSANLPLGDNTAIRVAGYTYTYDGFSENPYTGNDSELENYGLRARLMSALTNNLTLNIIADYSNKDDNNPTTLTYYKVPTGSPLFNALADCGITASPDNTDNCSDNRRRTQTENTGLSLQLDWDIGDVTLTSITAYRETDEERVNDILGIPTEIMQANLNFPNGCNPANIPCGLANTITPGYEGFPQLTDQNLFTQEIRLASNNDGPLEWVAGAYYQSSEYDRLAHKYITISIPSGFCASRPPFLGWEVYGPVSCRINSQIDNISVETDEWAVFGNVTYNLSEKTRLIAGLRYTDSEVTEQIINTSNTGINTSYDLTVTADDLTWRLGIQHDLDNDSMVYATIATGYKAPQIDDAINIDRDSSTPGNQYGFLGIDPETPINYEIGYKTAVLDGRLAFNANAFFMDVKDYQGEQCQPDYENGGIDCQPTNISNVESYGVEIDVFGRPTEHTTINLSGIYNIAEYPGGFYGVDGTDLAGEQLNYAPKYKVTLSAEHEIPMGNSLSVVVGGDLTWRDEQSMYSSALDVYVADATALFNARVGVRSEDDWSIFLFGRNLGDEIYPRSFYPTSAFHAGGYWTTLDYNSRRVVGLQADIRF